MNYDDFLLIIKKQKFYVYGAGSMGKRFIKCLENMGIKQNFLGYVVTEENHTYKSILDIPRESYVIISTHNETAKEMERLLINNQFKHYYLLYPFLLELEYGKSIEKNKKINVNDLLNNLDSTPYYAILMLTIDSVIKGYNNDAIYIKMMEKLSSDRKTALARSKEFYSRIIDYSKGNYNKENYPIKVNAEKDKIKDGAHRLMLAYYFGKTTINADIYDFKQEKYDEILDNVIYEKAKNTAVKFLGYRARSKKELRDKLIKDYDEDITNKVISMLEKYGYVNDEEYARAYVRDCLNLKGWGQKRIALELTKRGIDKSIIEKSLPKENTEQLELIEKLLTKRLKGNTNIDFKEKKKHFDYLARRGFLPSDILEVFDKVLVKEDW